MTERPWWFAGSAAALSLMALVLAGCAPQPSAPQRPFTGRPPAPALTPAPGVSGDPERGRALFTDSRIMAPNGCATCHTVRGVPGATGIVGPNLTNVSLRPTLAGDTIANSPENMVRWIMNAPALKSGTKMPALAGVTEQQARDLTAFLYSLPYNPSAR